MNSSDEFVRLYKSGPMMNNFRPSFPAQKLKLSSLCNADKSLPIKFEVVSYAENGSDVPYGSFCTTTTEATQKKEFDLLTRGGGRAGVFKFDTFGIFEQPNFMEYLRSGWAINLSCAIDFTASNKDIVFSDSLHFQHQNGNLNQYEQALLSVGRVVEPYAMDQQFAVFGFGAKPLHLGSNQVSHCFNLNGLPDPRIKGFQNVFNAYKQTIGRIQLSGPTKFSFVLKSLLSYVQMNLQLQMYHVMLILTDGDIHDKDETTDLIIELSQYPVSIIIIGVGDESFEIMKFFDSDGTILRNSRGKAAARDIVQFVKFKDYSHADISVLASEVLKELPDQLVGYMLSKGVKPLKLEWVNVDSAVQNVAIQSGVQNLMMQQMQ